MPGTDSAGQPWEGRTFEPNHAADDDGSAPEHLLEALRRFRARELGEVEVVDAIRSARLLIPLVAHLGEADDHGHGHEHEGVNGLRIDKSQELAIVTVTGPDGRTVLPAFTSVDAMRSWNPEARPIPAGAVRVAAAAVHEGTDLVVVDPTSETEFVLRRPTILAIAQGIVWAPSHQDPAVLAAFVEGLEGEPAIGSIELVPGDPDARLAGPELIVRLELAPGLTRERLDELLGRVQLRWSSSQVIASRVDSMRVQLVASA